MNILHPILFSLLPTVILYSNNKGEVWPNITFLPAIYSIFFVAISWFIFFIFFKNKEKTSIFTSIWTILFFFYGHFYLFLSDLKFFNFIPVGLNTVLFIFYFFVLGTSFVCLFKTDKQLKVVNNLFNIMAVGLFLFNMFIIVPFEAKRAVAYVKLKKYISQNKITSNVKNRDKNSYPDIYYFIFDRYANQKILSKYFGYDNSRMIDFFEKNNFYVGKNSFANYPATFLSLSSSLNMEYLNFLEDILGDNYSDKAVVYSLLLQNNQVVNFLKERGYNYIHIGSSYTPTKSNRLANKNYSRFSKTDKFQLLIYENTLMNTISEKLFSKRTYSGVSLLEETIATLPFELKTIDKQISVKGPKFVFAHILLPHRPFLFSEDCVPLNFEIIRKTSNEQGYINQLRCANKEIKTIVDTINKKSQMPAVVIFQSDEGPYTPDKYFINGAAIKKGNKDSYQIHSLILNAYFFPDKKNKKQAADYEEIGLYDSFTPVNSFKLIFNYYFGTNFKLLEDKSYIPKDEKYPYKFIEITKDLK